MPVTRSSIEIRDETELKVLEDLYNKNYLSSDEVVETQETMDFGQPLAMEKVGVLTEVDGRIIDSQSLPQGIDVQHAEIYRLSQDDFRHLNASDRQQFMIDYHFDPRWYKSTASPDPMDVGFYFVRWSDAEGNAHYCDLSTVMRPDLRDDFAAFTYGSATAGGQVMGAATPDPNVTDHIAVVNPGSTEGQAVGASEFFIPRADAIDLILGGWTAHVQSGIVYYDFMEGQ